MGFWALRTRHVPDSGLELGLLFSGIARSGFDAGIYWMLYVALEPFVRRMWPDALISWSRALMGRMRDPLVGRDLLIGCLFGVLLQLFTPLSRLLDAVTGFPPTRPSAALWGFDGVRGLAVALVTAVGDSPGWPLILLFFLVLFRVILRRPWLATLAVLVVFGVLSTLEPRTFAPSSLTGAIMNAVSLTVLIRFGVVALITTTFTLNILTLSSITSDLGAWYAGYGLVGLVLLVALALYGFRTSLAGRPLFGQGLFDA